MLRKVENLRKILRDLAMLADISQFEALCSGTGNAVFNSAAAVVMQNYDQNKKGVLLCEKYIKEMQAEEYIPAELISQMYETKEKFSDELLKLKQVVMAQTTNEPLDAFDREIYMSLSEGTKADLKIVLDTDKVFQRALEMKDEAAAPEETDSETEAAPSKTEERPKVVQKDKDKKAAPKQDKNEIALPDSDDFALDVASEEA